MIIPETFWFKLGDAAWWLTLAVLMNVIGNLSFKFIEAVYRKKKYENS